MSSSQVPKFQTDENFPGKVGRIRPAAGRWKPPAACTTRCAGMKARTHSTGLCLAGTIHLPVFGRFLTPTRATEFGPESRPHVSQKPDPIGCTLGPRSACQRFFPGTGKKR